MARRIATLHDGELTRKERKALRELQRVTTGITDSGNDDDVERLPVASGMKQLSGYWSFPVRRPYHRATGFQIAAANTLAAADVHDPMGPVIGIEKLSGGCAFTFDPWQMYLSGLVSSPNLIIEGTLRQGKSYFIKRLLSLLVEVGHFAINTSDSKGEHGVLALELGGDVFKIGVFGSGIRINPLEAGEKRLNETDAEYGARIKASRVSVLQQIAGLLNPGERPVTARESGLLDWALDAVVQNTSNRPTIRLVWEKLGSAEMRSAQGGYFAWDDGNDLRDGFRRLVQGDLGGMFDDHSTVNLREESPYTVVDTFGISQRGTGALAVTQAVTNAWVQNTISNKASGRRYFLIREEGWRDMKSVAALEAHQEQLKLSGEYGIAMVLIVHEAGDFDSVGPEGSKERELAKSLLRGYANRVCFLQPESALRYAVQSGTYTQAEANAIGGLRCGQFLIKLKERSYVVDGNPTSTDWERRIFDTDAQMRAREAEAT